ncbi:hypothetical protein AVDCRST_MAG84-1642 [uncultured Microcoleus sp.]|uniref:Uncharacterized protein n=1 Tax=uncultured Microcoleus sp. TaxID=259945 RepID=A0A6J4L8K1_9CYAN|nr:hypothetical protein AVDCRST_MAG84-1642 [uncultured Microcoleus sp.]
MNCRHSLSYLEMHLLFIYQSKIYAISLIKLGDQASLYEKILAD